MVGWIKPRIFFAIPENIHLSGLVSSLIHLESPNCPGCISIVFHYGFKSHEYSSFWFIPSPWKGRRCSKHPFFPAKNAQVLWRFRWIFPNLQGIAKKIAKLFAADAWWATDQDLGVVVVKPPPQLFHMMAIYTKKTEVNFSKWSYRIYLGNPVYVSHWDYRIIFVFWTQCPLKGTS